MKKQEIKANKKGRVTFSVDMSSYEKSMTLYQEAQRRPNFSKMKDQVLLYLHEGKYDETSEYLKVYMPQEISEFYYAKGKILLSWAINYSTNSKSMEFLIRNMPRDLVEEILSKNDFSMLVCFLGSQSHLDQLNSYNAEEMIKKIKILLNFNCSKITQAIEDNISNKDFISSNIKQSFELAKLRM